jgi:hypothetical protein
MAIDPRKRQKKLERQKAKKKAERRELTRRDSVGLAVRIQRESQAPILHCYSTPELLANGIGEVLISRKLSHGNVAFVMFLVDMYCLGVKDLVVDILPEATYRKNIYEKMAERVTPTRMKPECARKLVEGAVQYALDLELPPHADYDIGRRIFGDISAAACTEEFSYGKDGKRYFVAGPNDDEAKCRLVLRLMEKHCEPGEWHYLLPFSAEKLARITQQETPSDD